MKKSVCWDGEGGNGNVVGALEHSGAHKICSLLYCFVLSFRVDQTFLDSRQKCRRMVLG